MLVEKPNILIIHADQHRWDCINVYGNKDIKTPNLNALATDGIIFTNCFSTFPLCTPARYSFLTGLYAHQHLGWTNRSTIPHGLDTFPKILKSLGYITKCIGKMHFTPTYLDVGFDEMILSEQDGPGRYDDDYHKFLKDNDMADYIDMQDQIFEYRTKAPKKYYETFGIDPTNLDEEYYSTTWIANRACEVIENWSENGNLLMIGFIKPHHPHDVPKKWSKLYDPQELSLLPGWTNQCLIKILSLEKDFLIIVN
jgi:arylsulfatase A-like enzyme